MEIAKIKVSGTEAKTAAKKAIPTGLVGGSVTIEYADGIWEGLTKTVIFRCGNVTKDVVTDAASVMIPAEVLEHPAEKLYVGIYGTRGDQTLAVPTLWANIGPVRAAAKPSGDAFTNASLPVWAQLAERISDLEKGGVGTPGADGKDGADGKNGADGKDGADGEDGGYYTPAVTVLDTNTVEFSFSASQADMPAAAPVQLELPNQDAVLYTAQDLTEEQKVQTRENIGAASAEDMDTILEAVPVVNILPPDYQLGYWDVETREIIYAETNCVTLNPIPVTGGKTVYATWDDTCEVYTNKMYCAVFFDSEGNQMGYTSAYFGKDRDDRIVRDFSVPSGCTHMHFWINNYWKGLRLEQLCLSYDSNHGFIPYEEPGKKAIKTNILNKNALKNFAPLLGKTVVNFGDSIFGKNRPPFDISSELADLTGAAVYNCGFGGCRMSQHPMSNFDAFSMYRIADSIASGNWSYQDAAMADTTQSETLPDYFYEGLTFLRSADFNKVDMITIAYGTNDFTGNADLDNADDPKDVATYSGALRYSIERLLTAYPHLKIFVCSQTYRFWMDAANVFTEDSDTYVNGNLVKLTDFVAATKQVAQEYHLPYIDNYYSLGFNKLSRTKYFTAADGTHPNTPGCRLIAAHMAKALF